MRLTRSLLGLAALASGCDGSLQPVLCDGGACGAQVSWRKSYHAGHSGKVDILFVVDDTAAMAPHRDALAAALPVMAETLRGPIAPTSLHVGFIRTGNCDTSTRGPACGVGGEQFLRSEWCHTIDNFSGDYAETFACLGDLGVADCGPSQPLAAAHRFLTGAPPPGWEGFARPEAYMMIVVVTPQDDASGPQAAPTPTVEIAAGIKATKQDPSQIIVSIVGPGGNCAADTSGPRLLSFANEFGSNGLYLPLCSGNFSGALQRLTEQINSQISPPCSTNVRDVDPVTPGLQADCSVEDSTTAPDGTRTGGRLPSCDESAPPCWRLARGSSFNCNGYIFEILRAPDWCVESGVSGTIECLGCAAANDPACKPVP